MEQDNTKRIEKEIRQYKLNKIQSIESRVKEYEDVYASIRENIVLKFTKNVTSNVIRGVSLFIALLLISIGIWLIFPESFIRFLEKNGEAFSELERNDFILTAPYTGGFLMFIAVLFYTISILLRKNIQKRNTIFKLSSLVKEVIGTMDENVKEDKIKYEYFVDSMSDIENADGNNKKNFKADASEV